MLNNQTISQALTPRRARWWPTALLVVAVVFMIVMAVVGFLQNARTERVIIVVRPIAFGQQITAADLATVEVSRHRPQQLAGVTDPRTVIGKYASQTMLVNQLLQPSMVMDTASNQPVYPSGEQLAVDMVAIPFSTETTGPITHTDTLNLGFYDESGDRRRCHDPGDPPIVESLSPEAGESSDRGAAATDAVTDTTTRLPDATSDHVDVHGETAMGQPYACRFLVEINVLYVDAKQSKAYLELTPYQAQAVRAVQAAALPLYAERASVMTTSLEPLERLDPSQFTRRALERVATRAQSQPTELPSQSGTRPASAVGR